MYNIENKVEINNVLKILEMSNNTYEFVNVKASWTSNIYLEHFIQDIQKWILEKVKN